jgi:hypothetical protein
MALAAAYIEMAKYGSGRQWPTSICSENNGLSRRKRIVHGIWQQHQQKAARRQSQIMAKMRKLAKMAPVQRQSIRRYRIWRRRYQLAGAMA